MKAIFRSIRRCCRREFENFGGDTAPGKVNDVSEKKMNKFKSILAAHTDAVLGEDTDLLPLLYAFTTVGSGPEKRLTAGMTEKELAKF